jgi:hypothetical protein
MDINDNTNPQDLPPFNPAAYPVVTALVRAYASDEPVEVEALLGDDMTERGLSFAFIVVLWAAWRMLAESGGQSFEEVLASTERAADRLSSGHPILTRLHPPQSAG